MFKTKPVLLAACLAFSLPGCAPAPETLFADGEAAFAAFDYRAARVQIAAGLEQQPDNTEMRVLLVRTLLNLGQGEVASNQIAALDPAVRSQNRIKLLQGEADVLRGQFDAAIGGMEGLESADADRVRALAFIGKGEADSAVASFEVGMAREDGSARLTASFARFEFERGQWNRADELSKQAMGMDHRLIDAMQVRADLAERRNELTQSLAIYERILALHAQNFGAQMGKARVLAKTGDAKGALQIVEALEPEQPDSPALAGVRARVAATREDWPEVRRVLQPFERKLPSMPDAAVLYAQALLELGQPGLARAYLAPEFERQPGWRDLRVLYARAEMGSGNTQAALAAMRPLAVRPDASPAELRLAAAIAKSAGEPDAARLEGRANRPAPEWVGGAIARADRALRNQQWSVAEAAYLEIVEKLGPSNAMVLNNLAFVQGKLGKPQEALARALQAAELEPSNASVLDTAGTLLVSNGQRPRGITMLRKAAGIAPDNTAIARHLAEALAAS